MKAKTAKNVVIVTILSWVIGAGRPSAAFASAVPGFAAQDAAPAAVVRRVGTVKSINGMTITLALDSGPEVSVIVQPATRMMRVPPGEKDLKNATPVQLTELQVGDRLLVAGKGSDDAKSLTASSIVVMKRSDLDARQEQVRQDWQKRGMGGLVSAVDTVSGTVTISITGFGGTKNVAVHTSKQTVIRRYSPDSVKFEDAKLGTLLEIAPGDQLRTLGTRSADGTEFTAEEIVTGSFRNIAGTVNSVDASAGTLSVQDLLSNKTVQVKITSDSQLHKIPPEIAQRFAMRLKASMPPGMPGAGGTPSSGSPATSAPQGQGTQSASSGTRPSGGGFGGGGNGGARSGGSFDLQQMLNRMPAVALADLHKGDAVMMVTTQGSASSPGTAITLLSGVEPILEAAPKGSQAMMLAPWSLGGAPGGDAANQ
jgi:hypothetical protein